MLFKLRFLLYIGLLKPLAANCLVMTSRTLFHRTTVVVVAVGVLGSISSKYSSYNVRCSITNSAGKSGTFQSVSLLSIQKLCSLMQHSTNEGTACKPNSIGHLKTRHLFTIMPNACSIFIRNCET